ncbi:hypothetical protein LINPERHAP1_LOCUS22361, partial [Linum perenne]
MRERERVRFRQKIGLAVSVSARTRLERGCERLGGVSSQDQQSRPLQIRNFRIFFESLDDRFSSSCRLVVSRGPLLHFIYLDNTLLVWLEHVLQVSSQNSWKFPASCERSTPNRTLKISTFSLRGLPVLKLIESCDRDKYFFVLIPADSIAPSWFDFVRLTQNWIAARNILPPPPMLSTPGRFVSPHKSFAQAVGSPLSVSGSCEIQKFGSMDGICVKDVGVDDQLAFLERCIVFRFVSSECIDWSSFRRWAHQNWVIQLDRWIPVADRSGVLLSDDVVWATFRGIPLHLRSTALFHQLGDICGHFLSFEKSDSLSSVRICFRLKGVINEEIPLCFKGLVYPVSVELDSPPPSSCCRFPSDSAPVWHSKRKSVLQTYSASPLDLDARVSADPQWSFLHPDSKSPTACSMVGVVKSSACSPAGSSTVLLSPPWLKARLPSSFTSSSSPPISATEAASLMCSCSPSLTFVDQTHLEDTLLNSSIIEVSKVLGLELEGSPSSGSTAAIATCREVIRRRSSYRSRSRQELELRRLGASADSLMS